MNRPSVGPAYAAVTFTLLVAVFASVTCLSTAASLQQETTCQTMMSLSPDPQLLQQGDFAIAVGGGQVRIQDRIRVADDRDQTGAHARHRRHG